MDAPEADTAGGLPDIPGLTLDEVRALIHDQLGVSIGRDDPLLASYVLHGAFLRDYEAMLGRHDAALTALFERSVADWTEGVSAKVAALTDELLSEGLKERIALLAEYSRLTHDAYHRMRRLTFWIAVLTVLTGVGAAVAVAALFLALR